MSRSLGELSGTRGIDKASPARLETQGTSPELGTGEAGTPPPPSRVIGGQPARDLLSPSGAVVTSNSSSSDSDSDIFFDSLPDFVEPQLLTLTASGNYDTAEFADSDSLPLTEVDGEEFGKVICHHSDSTSVQSEALTSQRISQAVGALAFVEEEFCKHEQVVNPPGDRVTTHPNADKRVNLTPGAPRLQQQQQPQQGDVQSSHCTDISWGLPHASAVTPVKVTSANSGTNIVQTDKHLEDSYLTSQEDTGNPKLHEDQYGCQEVVKAQGHYAKECTSEGHGLLEEALISSSQEEVHEDKVLRAEGSVGEEEVTGREVLHLDPLVPPCGECFTSSGPLWDITPVRLVSHPDHSSARVFSPADLLPIVTEINKRKTRAREEEQESSCSAGPLVAESDSGTTLRSGQPKTTPTHLDVADDDKNGVRHLGAALPPEDDRECKESQVSVAEPAVSSVSTTCTFDALSEWNKTETVSLRDLSVKCTPCVLESYLYHNTETHHLELAHPSFFQDEIQQQQVASVLQTIGDLLIVADVIIPPQCRSDSQSRVTEVCTTTHTISPDIHALNSVSSDHLLIAHVAYTQIQETKAENFPRSASDTQNTASVGDLKQSDVLLDVNVVTDRVDDVSKLSYEEAVCVHAHREKDSELVTHSEFVTDRVTSQDSQLVTFEENELTAQEDQNTHLTTPVGQDIELTDTDEQDTPFGTPYREAIPLTTLDEVDIPLITHDEQDSHIITPDEQDTHLITPDDEQDPHLITPDEQDTHLITSDEQDTHLITPDEQDSHLITPDDEQDTHFITPDDEQDSHLITSDEQDSHLITPDDEQDSHLITSDEQDSHLITSDEQDTHLITPDDEQDSHLITSDEQDTHLITPDDQDSHLITPDDEQDSHLITSDEQDTHLITSDEQDTHLITPDEQDTHLITPDEQDTYLTTHEKQDTHLITPDEQDTFLTTHEKQDSHLSSPEKQGTQLSVRKESTTKTDEVNVNQIELDTHDLRSGSQSNRRTRSQRNASTGEDSISVRGTIATRGRRAKTDSESDASRRELDLLVASYRLAISDDSPSLSGKPSSFKPLVKSVARPADALSSHIEARKSLPVDALSSHIDALTSLPADALLLPTHTCTSLPVDTKASQPSDSEATAQPQRRTGRRVVRRSITADYLRGTAKPEIDDILLSRDALLSDDAAFGNEAKLSGDVTSPLSHSLSDFKPRALDLSSGLTSPTPRGLFGGVGWCAVDKHWDIGGISAPPPAISAPPPHFSSTPDLSERHLPTNTNSTHPLGGADDLHTQQLKRSDLSPLSWASGSLPRLKGRTSKGKLRHGTHSEPSSPTSKTPSNSLSMYVASAVCRAGDSIMEPNSASTPGSANSLHARRKSDSTLICSNSREFANMLSGQRRPSAIGLGRKYSFAGIPKAVQPHRSALLRGDSIQEHSSENYQSHKESVQNQNNANLNIDNEDYAASRSDSCDATSYSNGGFDKSPSPGSREHVKVAGMNPQQQQQQHPSQAAGLSRVSSYSTPHSHDGSVLLYNSPSCPASPQHHHHYYHHHQQQQHQQHLGENYCAPHSKPNFTPPYLTTNYVCTDSTTPPTDMPASESTNVTMATKHDGGVRGVGESGSYGSCTVGRHAARLNNAVSAAAATAEQQIEKARRSIRLAGLQHLGNVLYHTPTKLKPATSVSILHNLPAGSPRTQPPTTPSGPEQHQQQQRAQPSHIPQTFHTFSRLRSFRSTVRNKDVFQSESSFSTAGYYPLKRSNSAIGMDTSNGVVMPASRQPNVAVSSTMRTPEGHDTASTMTSPATSRTGTPTLVRSRPRLPTSLLGKSPGDTTVGHGGMEDLSGALSSLGNTDFVSKYSRRPKRPPSGVTSPSTMASSPGANDKPPICSPTTESGSIPQKRGSLTLTRMRSIKLKLQRVKDRREKSEKDDLGRDENSSHHIDNAIQSDSKVIVAPSPDRAVISHPFEPTSGNSLILNTATSSVNGEASPAILPLHSFHTLPGSIMSFARGSPGPTICGDQSGTAIPVIELNSTKDATTVISSTHPISVSSLKSTPKTVFSSLQDLSTSIADTGTEVTWKHTLHTPEQFKEAAQQIETLMASSHDITSTPSSSTNQPSTQVEFKLTPQTTRRRGLLKATTSTDSEGSSTSSHQKPVCAGDSPEATSLLSLHITDQDDDTASPLPPRRQVRITRHKYVPESSIETEDEGLGAMDGYDLGEGDDTDSRHSHVLIPTIVAPSEDDHVSNGSYRAQTSDEFGERPGERSSQHSVASLDSHLEPADEEPASSYHEVVQDITSQRGNTGTVFERKNSKQLKHKSKSDPCGEKQENIDIPAVIASHAQSAPVLDESRDTVSQLPEFSRSDAERRISRSDNALSSSDTPVDSSSEPRLKEVSVRVVDTSGDSSEDVLLASPPPTPRQPHRRSSKKRQRSLAVAIQKWEQREGVDSDGKPTKPSASPKIKSIKHARSPHQSPENTLEKKGKRSGLASLGLPLAKKSSLTRSQSSASVLLREKQERSRSKDGQGDPKVNKGEVHVGDLHSPGSGRSQRDKAVTGAFSPSLEPIFSQSTLSLFEGSAEEKEKRDLIVQEFYSTEQQYVETLQMLVEKYMIPMKAAASLDSNMVDDIFYKINEIYMHHATFLTFLGRAVTTWDHRTTIGDVIYRNFSKETVIGSYVSFIDNFPRAEKVLVEISNKTSFQKFVEQIEKQGRRLPLKAMIIQPAQRIPRYELLIKRLLDNTPVDHPDHEQLEKAEKAVHKMALKINSVKESKHGADLQETLKKLELLLMTDLIAPDRLYLRHDMINLLNRKDPCCIWLFSDLVVFSSIKRKSGPVSRKTTLLLQSSAGNDFVENTKHKTWLKIPLDDLEILKGGGPLTKRPLVDKELLEEDFMLLNNIVDLSNQLNCGHGNLDEVIYELRSRINKQLSEHQLKSPPPEANRVELLATTTEGLTNVIIVFPSPDKRASWESAFIESKQKLADNTVGRPPEFLQALQITKTRAGMQFSCASPIDGLNAKQHCDVWVCNSDGYVGHMCLLSLQPEPIVTLNTPVPGCNSRILCICAVPPYQSFRRKGSGRRHVMSQVQAPQIRIEETEEEDDEEDHDGYLSDSSSSSLSDDEFDDVVDMGNGSQGSLGVHFPDEERSRSPSLDLGHKEAFPLDPLKCTMWLGTEDGCILIFPSTENIKTTKNKVKVQQSSGILCIAHYDQKVFVSLANGDIVVYNRDHSGVWDVGNPEVMSVSNAAAPVNKMHAVAGKLWCTSHNEVMVLNPNSLQIEVTFQAGSDEKRGLQCVASSGLAVWIAPQGGASVLLFHATTYELLMEVSVKHAVTQKLQATDDIIRQHKTACLRITALLTCKDLLWIGTSAGVLLTVPMPKIASTTTRNDVVPPTVSGLVYGHTGHVRFLTSVEMPLPKFPQSLLASSPTSDSPPPETTPRRPSWMARRASLTQHTLTLATKMLIISGGDGYEDFRNNANNESAGKDDSTNHLLLWQV